jgi:hypothetical protein
MKRVFYVVPAVLLVASRVYTAARRGQKIGFDELRMDTLSRGTHGCRRRCRKPTTAQARHDDGGGPSAAWRTCASQFGQCSINGVPNPMQGKNLEQELKTKAEIIKALADSFALCDKAFDAVTDANATEMVKQGQNEITRAAALYGVLVHGNEMAGTAYVYLRSKNIVPVDRSRRTRDADRC